MPSLSSLNSICFRRLSIAAQPEHRRASVTLPSTTTSGLASSSLFLSADHALALPLIIPQSRSGEITSAVVATPRTPRTPAISVSESLHGQREDTLQEQPEEQQEKDDTAGSEVLADSQV